MTINEFRENVKKYGNAPDVEILEFTGTYKECKIFCKKCKSESTVYHASCLYYRDCCKKCAIEHYSKIRKLDAKSFMENVIKKGNADDVVLLSGYVSPNEKALFKCLRCDTEFSCRANSLYNGRMCPTCFKNNCYTKHAHCKTISETNKDMFLWLKNKDDGYKYCQGSHVNLEWLCPICGSTVIASPLNIKKTGIMSCKFCSDGISYPNKFLANLLKECNINFKSEAGFGWSKLNGRFCYKYDFYLSEYNMIIEAMGLQHYEKGYYISLEKIQEIDKNKEMLAINNGIQYYLALDCRKSDLEFIKNSILFSELNNILPKNIDWNAVEYKSLGSLLVEICCEYNKDKTISIPELAKRFNVHRATVSRYLKRGANIKLCDYTCKDAVRRGQNHILKY